MKNENQWVRTVDWTFDQYMQVEEPEMGDMADMIIENELDTLLNYGDSKPNGPGPCPICNGETYLIEGVNGKFYGCKNFPECKGSRNYNE